MNHGSHHGHSGHGDGSSSTHRTDDPGRGHDRHEGHTPEMFRDRLLFSLVLTVPVLYFSEQIQEWFEFTALEFGGDHLVQPVLASVLFIYGGGVFLRGAGHEWAARRPGMMTLISIAISVAYGYSLAVSLGLSGEPFYWELATLIDVMLLGHWIEMRSVQSASAALQHLASMVPNEAHLVTDSGVRDIPVSDLEVGNIILIRPGEQVPVDGEITSGRSSFNEAFLTGESKPVDKEVGSEVVAGSVNGDGAVEVEVTRTGDATTLSQIMRLVEEAQASRSGFQVLADRAALWLTFVAIGAATPTLVVWLLLGKGAAFAVARAVTVLVIACPHALGLAIPLVNVNATAVSASNGILVRNREAFERGRNIRLMAFDKTGTLTEGAFSVSGFATNGDETSILQIAAGLETASEHPLAGAIVSAVAERGLRPADVDDVTAVPGHGLEGTVAGERYRIGRPEWAGELGVTVDGPIADVLEVADARGESAVVMFRNDRAVAAFRVADRVRVQARTAIARLREAGVEPVMITGDAEAVARTVAGDLGIDRFHARVLPGDKAALVRDLKRSGPTAFVGDGINDAPALLEADLGLAIGAGTNVAIESADLVLVDDDPSDAVAALRLSKATHRKMVQNLGWATWYNAIAIPLAAGVATGIGITLDPAVGALFMSLSTVIVAVNAMLLRRIDIS